MVVGNASVAYCGVTDYARRLSAELAPLGIAAAVASPARWNLAGLRRLRRSTAFGAAAIVHIQYPSVGFRRSLMPHFIGLASAGKRVVVTLHEYSRLPLPQRWSLHAFRLTGDEIVFTSDEERRHFTVFPAKLPTRVIPIGPNVPAAPPADEREATVLYFGQLRPDKGLEQFLELAALAQARETPLRFAVIGSTLAKHDRYVAGLRATYSGTRVEWAMDLPPEPVAARMARSFAAYLPFPDGASLRRGSLLAALANGLVVVTTSGPATSAALQECCILAATPDEALAQCGRLLELPAEAATYRARARQFMETRSWRAIALQHASLYAGLLERTERRRTT